MAKLEELELKIKALELEIELMKLKENYPQKTPEYYPKYPDLGTGDYYPVWYPQTICLDK